VKGKEKAKTRRVISVKPRPSLLLPHFRKYNSCKHRELRIDRFVLQVLVPHTALLQVFSQSIATLWVSLLWWISLKMLLLLQQTTDQQSQIDCWRRDHDALSVMTKTLRILEPLIEERATMGKGNESAVDVEQKMLLVLSGTFSQALCSRVEEDHRQIQSPRIPQYESLLVAILRYAAMQCTANVASHTFRLFLIEKIVQSGSATNSVALFVSAYRTVLFPLLMLLSTGLHHPHASPVPLQTEWRNLPERARAILMLCSWILL
jgi:hypothetical protein